MHYVTDTHSLVWYFTDDPRLSRKALEAFEETTREGLIIVPSIVLAEIIYIAKKGKITVTFEQTLKKVEDYENFEIVALDVDVLIVVDKIEADLEMHDKIIVATALHSKATLITKDKPIKEAGIVSTIWSAPEDEYVA